MTTATTARHTLELTNYEALHIWARINDAARTERFQAPKIRATPERQADLGNAAEVMHEAYNSRTPQATTASLTRGELSAIADQIDDLISGSLYRPAASHAHYVSGVAKIRALLAALPYACEHCGHTHDAAADTLVTVTLCPGGDCEEDCPELEAEARCFADYAEAQAYAQRVSGAHPEGAALVWSVYTADENRDVQTCIATVVRGDVLPNA